MAHRHGGRAMGESACWSWAVAELLTATVGLAGTLAAASGWSLICLKGVAVLCAQTHTGTNRTFDPPDRLLLVRSCAPLGPSAAKMALSPAPLLPLAAGRRWLPKFIPLATPKRPRHFEPAFLLTHPVCVTRHESIASAISSTARHPLLSSSATCLRAEQRACHIYSPSLIHPVRVTKSQPVADSSRASRCCLETARLTFLLPRTPTSRPSAKLLSNPGTFVLLSTLHRHLRPPKHPPSLSTGDLRRQVAELSAGAPADLEKHGFELNNRFSTSSDPASHHPPRMPSTNPRRTTSTKTTSSAVTPIVPVNTNMASLRNGATFHGPPSPTLDLVKPCLVRRAQTTLENVSEEHHKRRVAITLGDIDRALSAVDTPVSSENTKSFRDTSSPVPQSFLNHTVARNNIMSDYNVGGRSLRPRHQRQANLHKSDSGLGSSIVSSQNDKSTSASTITRSAAHPSTRESLSRMGERASTKIHEHILKPLLAKSSLKDFHPIVRDCPRRIQEKEIVCLRDLEKTLIFMAPVSDVLSDDVAGAITHWYSSLVKERSSSAKLYLEFCLTSIRCIQATVEFLHEREQTRPHDRPYSNGYFVDLVDQIRNYAQSVRSTKEKEAKGEELDEMDCESSDELKLYGGVTKNGRPAELVRVKKSGKAISLATGENIKIDSIEEDEKGGVMMKRSLSEQEADDEEIMRSMARRKRSASAAELAPKRCHEPGCKKEFKRSCDLTKHEKTHTRPWKCGEISCKYHEYGWPTEKELDRHVNDKHSSSPILYKCQFAPCPYQSKRESNCKQHMEKSHDWKYVRSKNNGKNRSKTDSSIPTPPTTHIQTPDDNSIGAYTPEEGIDNEDYPVTDFALFPGQMPFPEYNPDYTAPQPFHMPADEGFYPGSSVDTSPFQMDLDQDVVANFGSNFTLHHMDNFPVYEEDIYNARVQIPVGQLPTPEHSIFRRSDSYHSVEPIPHISPIGHGNTMLYTPTSAIEDSFDRIPQETGDDFELFTHAHVNMLSNQVIGHNSLFGEIPSHGTGYSQSNTQEYIPGYGNMHLGMEWAHDEGYGYGDQ